MASISLADIRAAALRIESRIKNTPMQRSWTLSTLSGADVYIKFENLQFTAAFKERGALNKLLQMRADEHVGVIAMSAGNHAKAVAYHAIKLGMAATIVMPRGTPNVKVTDTENFGATVVLHGDSLDEAASYAREQAQLKGLTFVHPYDDADIIAGQGTIALEMLEKVPDLDVLVVPVGGGGLIAGMAIAAKGINPNIEVLGVESASYPSVAALLSGETPQWGSSTIAEGIAVKHPGTLSLEIIREFVDEVLVVDEAAIEEAVTTYITIEKTVAEGAGAASLAALFAFPERFTGRRVGIVLSGGNIDTRILSSVLMRHLARSRRIAQFRMQVSDSPGALAKITAIVAALEGNILDISHQRTFTRAGVRDTGLEMTVETRNAVHTAAVRDAIAAAGYQVELLD